MGEKRLAAARCLSLNQVQTELSARSPQLPQLLVGKAQRHFVTLGSHEPAITVRSLKFPAASIAIPQPPDS